MYHKNKINTKYSNYSTRKAGIEVDTIVIHYTQLGFKDSHKVLTQSGKVSSHFLINEKGGVHQLVPLNYKAWHAGISCWRGRSDINQNSIGIEIVNGGMELKFLKDSVQVVKVQEFRNAQYFALAKLINKMREIYPKISDQNIIGHSDVTAKTLRKIDPGVAFDWRFLNILGHGIYYEMEGKRYNDEVVYKLGDKGEGIKILQTRLQKLGYEVEANGVFDRYLANTIFAFKLHYFQHRIKQNSSISYGKWYKYFDDLIINGIVVPGGFGKRGIEEKISAIKFARINKIPFFGICLGMQLATIEFARNVLNISDANSTEFDLECTNVFDLMQNQIKDNNLESKSSKTKMGGTLRLGNYKCTLEKDTKIQNIYKSLQIEERHRHRYEFNVSLLSKFVNSDLRFSGMSSDNKYIEAMELKSHPWFIGVQYHPEYKSRPFSPHPLFVSFINSAKNRLSS